ncbi:hypothetical protein ACQSSU_20290 [Micromonospora echinospora]
MSDRVAPTQPEETLMLNLTAARRAPQQLPTTEDRYHAAEQDFARIHRRLRKRMPGSHRAALLGSLYAHLSLMAYTHHEVFGDDPIPTEPGRDHADSIGASALLMQLLADVEYAATWRTERLARDSVLEPYAGRVLNEMASNPDPEMRAALLDDLYDAVVDHIGEQAAEIIASLPAPGRPRNNPLRQCLIRAADNLPRAFAWGAAVAAAATLVGLAPIAGWPGIAATTTTAAIVGLLLCRTARVYALPGLLNGAALGLLIGAWTRPVAPNWQITAAGLTLAATAYGIGLWMHRRR